MKKSTFITFYSLLIAVCLIFVSLSACTKTDKPIVETEVEQDPPPTPEPEPEPLDELVITSLSGSNAHGGTLTINGAQFTVKAQAAPVKYDDFEGGAVGSPPGNGWDYTPNAGTGHKSPYYSADVLRDNSTRSMKCRFDQDGYLSSFGLKNNFGTEEGFFVSGWYYYDAASPRSRNHKVIRFHVGADGSPNAYINIYCADYTNIFGQDGVGAGEGKYVSWGTGNGWGSKYTENKWTHLQLWVKQSSPGLDDGSMTLWVDGKVANSIDALRTRGAEQSKWNTLWLGNYMGHSAGDGADCPASSDAFTYWDNVYIDTTPQRVVIANASSWEDANNFEVQKPIIWEDTKISIRVNRNSFAPTDVLYVFVVDSQNKISSGFLLN